METQNLARSCNETLILATLDSSPAHGYQIALDIDERSSGFFAFNHGTLYPILHDLEKRGLIDGNWADAPGRKRKEYSLTGAGRGELRARASEWKAFWAHFAALVPNAGYTAVPGQPAARSA